MKRFLMIWIALFFTASFAWSQTSPDFYLTQIPPAPKNACNLKADEKTPYLQTLRILKDRMDRDLLQKKEDLQVHVDASRDKAVAGATPRSAMEKVTAKGVGASESKPADPKAREAAGQVKIRHELQVEQKALLERINARKAPVLNKLKLLDQNAAAAKAKELDPIQRQISSMSGVVTSKEQTERMDKLAQKLKDAQKLYCETYSSQYLALLAEYLSAVKESLPDYKRQEEIIAKAQLGLDKPLDSNAGLMGIEALRDYVSLLGKVFKYDLPYEY